MNQAKKAYLGAIIISVIMFFVALATDIFWLGRWATGAFSSTMPVDPKVYGAFAAPDLILSLFLYIGSYGVLKLRKFGFVASLVGLGMWLFDSLLVLGITKLERINIVGPSLFFCIFSIAYLWVKKDLFN
jgi:hypothetical protein